jgi:hypothetical protein
VQRPFYYTTLGADPTNADVVYAGAEGFFKSTDGGRTMVSMRTPHGDNHDIWINPNDGDTMIQSNDGGANVSFDGGRTWSTQMNQVTSEIYGVWVDNAFPYKLYGAQQDNSTSIYSSIADPFDLTAWRTGPGCETGPIIPHPSDPNIVYGNCKGQYEYMSMQARQITGSTVHALRQRGTGPDPALPARLADGDVAARPGHPVLRLAETPSHARQGRDVGDDFAGSHLEPAARAGRER